MGMFSKIGENLVMKELAKKVGEVKVDQIVGAVLGEAHDLVDELKKDADNDGLAELDNIKEDLKIAHDKMADAFERIEAARDRVEARKKK